MVGSQFTTTLSLPCADCVVYAICYNLPNEKKTTIFECAIVEPYVETLIRDIHKDFYPQLEHNYVYSAIVSPYNMTIQIRRTVNTSMFAIDMIIDGYTLSYPAFFSWDL